MIGACKSRVASAFFVNVLRVGTYKNLGGVRGCTGGFGVMP